MQFATLLVPIILKQTTLQILLLGPIVIILV